jgi:hypothetical protein
VDVGYLDDTNDDLKYAVKISGSWSIETVDETGIVGVSASLALDAHGHPHIGYYDDTSHHLKYGAKTLGSWSIETVDATGNLDFITSLALDAQGNPHISYYNDADGDLEYASGAVAVATPAGGTIWPVGATRSVTWDGEGTVDISLSVDGGSSYTPMATGVLGGSYSLIVPHTPSKFSRVRIERHEDVNDFVSHVYRHSISETDSFFTIETSISLLNLLVSRSEDRPGLTVSWRTDPGPEDLDGYRLDKASSNRSFFTLVSRTKETTYHDPEGVGGDRYRLIAINTLGQEFVLGEGVSDHPPSLTGGIRVYPTPYQGGELTIEFGTAMVGGEVLQSELAIYDVIGRRVKTVAKGHFAPPSHRARWDGRDERGHRVASGIYFVRSTTSIGSHTQKLVIIR